MIKIFVVGKTKNKQINFLLEYYLKLSSKYQSIKFIVLPKHKAGGDRQIIKAQEAKNIKKILKKNELNIFLDEKGIAFTSLKFAKFIEVEQKQNINFFIAGSFGFDKDIKKYADILLSFSSFTFTHDIVRVLLIEQIYRALTISNGKEYHY